MKDKSRPKPFIYFTAWTILGTISTFAGFTLLRILVNPTAGKGNPIITTILGVLGFGILLPLVQWIILRRFLPDAYWWLVVSFAALALGLLIDQIVNRLVTYPIQVTFTIGMSVSFGLIVGTAQWLYLRHHFSKAIIWIFASALGWGLTTVATGMVIDSFFEQVLFGLMPALTTGLGLVYLLQEPFQESPNGLAYTSS